MTHSVFFQPADGWVGDLIPFQKDGEFWLFYLHEVRDDPKPGTSWNLVTTKDLTQFEDHGVSLRHGGDDDADFNAYTGSIVRDESGVHHLFYTGQNPRHLGPDGAPLQLVMHATSTDGMQTWVKHPELTFGAPAGYESGDWRDPFVFRDETRGQWRMLLAARHSEGPERRRGLIAQCVSADLVSWDHTEPFWDPRRYITHECPDVFAWGDWWYLVYSEFSESFTTRYRMAKSPDGPWIVPERDSIDGRAFYASKTAERDGRRFFFGWIASKEDNRDDGAWQWAGTMSVLEAHQNADGTLAFCLADELLESFWDEIPVTFDRALPATLRTPDGYAAVVSHEVLPRQFYARAVLRIEPDTTECGLLLRSSADGDRSYILRLEPKRGRMVFDRWPREVTGDAQWHVSGDVPFEIELERPCGLGPGEHTLELVVDGDLCVAVVDRQVTLSTRVYDLPDGRIGVFAGEGSVTVTELEIRKRTRQLNTSTASSVPITGDCPHEETVSNRRRGRGRRPRPLRLWRRRGRRPLQREPHRGNQAPRNLSWLLSRPADGGVINIMKKIADDYAKAHPGFSLNLISTPDRPSYIQKLETLAAANKLPELFDTDATPFAQQLAKQGKMVDAEKLLKSLDVYDSYRPNALDYQRFDDGSLYMIPFQFELEFIWYNKALLQKAGVSIPKSLDDIPAMCTALRNAGITPIAIDGQDQWPLERYVAYQPFRQAGPDFIQKLKKGEAKFSEPAGQKTVEWMSALGQAKCFQNGFSSQGYSDAQNQFTSGQAAMYNIGTWELPSLATDKLNPAVRDDIDFFTLPTTAGSVTTANEFVSPSGIGMAVNSKTYDPLVSDFLKFALQKYPSEYAATGALSPTKNVETAVPANATPLYKKALEKANDIGDKQAMPWDTQLDPTTNSRLQQELVLLVQGNIKPAEFTSTMEAIIAQNAPKFFK